MTDFTPVVQEHEATPTSQPKYARIAGTLAGKIRRGELAAGQQLPTERELCRTFEVASHTLRRALTLLNEEGLISREHGRGTFVADVNRPKPSLQHHPVPLIGFGPAAGNWEDPANWEVHMRCYRGIVEAGFACGLPVHSLELPAAQQTEEGFLKAMGNAAGLLVHTDTEHPPPASVLAALQGRGLPVVAINRHEYPVCSEVRVDIGYGASRVMAHLIELGHRRIALLSGGDNVWLQKREQAYRDALADAGIAVDPNLVVRAHPGLQSDAADATASLLSLPEPPSAIFAVNDLRAIGALKAAAERGLEVPRDLSIVGFDDIAAAERHQPALTTVRNPLDELGRQSVMLLDTLIRERCQDIRIRTLKPELIVRESCAPLAST